MKPYFYPDLEKQVLFKTGYIASKSSHSRGSAVDFTLLDMRTGKEVDMGKVRKFNGIPYIPSIRFTTGNEKSKISIQISYLPHGIL